MTKNPTDHPPRDAGLTIVELMISLLLTAVLTGGMFAMMSGQAMTYNSQHKALSRQGNIRGSMLYLSRQLQRAGYGFGRCPQGGVDMWDGSSGTQASPYQGFRHYNSCNILTTNPTTCPSVPISTPNSADSFTVTYAANSALGTTQGVRINQEILVSSADLTVDAPGGFSKNDLAMLWEPAGGKPCTLLQITDNPVAVGGTERFRLNHVPIATYNPPTSTNIFPTGGYADGSILVNLTAVNAVPRHFAIDSSTKPPRLVTWTTANANPSADKANLEVVADGIEDIQLAWACDVNNNGVLDEGINSGAKVTDEWYGNVISDTQPSCGTQAIASIRLTLVARDESATASFKQGYRPKVEDRVAGTSDDDKLLSGKTGTYARSMRVSTVRPYNLAGVAQ